MSATPFDCGTAERHLIDNQYRIVDRFDIWDNYNKFWDNGQMGYNFCPNIEGQIPYPIDPSTCFYAGAGTIIQHTDASVNMTFTQVSPYFDSVHDFKNYAYRRTGANLVTTGAVITASTVTDYGTFFSLDVPNGIFFVPAGWRAELSDPSVIRILSRGFYVLAKSNAGGAYGGSSIRMYQQGIIAEWDKIYRFGKIYAAFTQQAPESLVYPAYIPVYIDNFWRVSHGAFLGGNGGTTPYGTNQAEMLFSTLLPLRPNDWRNRADLVHAQFFGKAFIPISGDSAEPYFVTVSP